MRPPIFFASFFEQRKTVETLLKESRANADFYLLLSFASFITTLGLILGNTLVIMGGILVAPFLGPVLELGMGIASSSKEAVRRAIRVLARSALVVLAISFFTAFAIHSDMAAEEIRVASTPDLLFFFIAFSSGIIAAYSWVKQNITTTLPAIAVTVTLIPPLSAMGIALTVMSKDMILGASVLFGFNFLGIVLAGTLVFSLFGFYRLEPLEEKKIWQEGVEVAVEKDKEEERGK